MTGRRDDGYHTLETLFVLIDLADTVTLTLRDDGAIARAGDVAGVAAEDDLTLRAAEALRRAVPRRTAPGVTIGLNKRIPLGGGLGGGSSDAASVLLGLNRLWSLDLPRVRAGRDRCTARRRRAVLRLRATTRSRAESASGCRRCRFLRRGCCSRCLPRTRRHAEMFAARELTRNAPSAKIDVFSEAYGRNDLEPVVRSRIGAVADALDALRRVSAGARMTGSGACAFATFAKEVEARAALAALPRGLRASVVRTLARHPLASFAS